MKPLEMKSAIYLVVGVVVGIAVYAGYQRISSSSLNQTPEQVQGMPINNLPTTSNTPTSSLPISGTTTQPAQSAPKDWTTYINTAYGYSINYPSHYSISSCQQCTDLTVAGFITLTPPSPMRPGYGGIMITSVKDKQPSQTAVDYLNEISGLDANPVVGGSKQQYTLNGYPALKQITKGAASGYFTEDIFVVHGSTGLMFSFNGLTTTSNKDLPIDQYKNINDFELILSTLKFSK